MALLNILTYPDSRLSLKSEAVTDFDSELATLCDDMIETMYDAHGIGLAAPQVDVRKNIFVIDIDYSRDENTEVISNKNPQVFINPIISDPKGEVVYQEGCLSVPGYFEDVKRAEKIILKYQDVSGKEFEEEIEGTLAIVIQHENDHLLGRLFIDRLSFIKRKSIKKKILKELKD